MKLEKKGDKSAIRNKFLFQMSAGKVIYCPVVECGTFFTEHEVIFLSQPKSALFGGGNIGLGSVQDFPVHALVYTLLISLLWLTGNFWSRIEGPKKTNKVYFYI